MHKQYRLNVWKNERLWCRIDADSPWAREVVDDLLSRLSAEEGYFVELLVATEDRRIFESGPDGLRLLACEPIYKPVTQDMRLASESGMIDAKQRLPVV